MANDEGWVSNIGLIVSQGRSICVRELEINIRRLGGAVGLSDALESFGFGSASWTSIAKLDMRSRLSDSAAEYQSVHSSAQRVVRLTEYFKRHVSNIKHLRLDLYEHEEFNCMLANGLVDAYLSQLSKLDAGYRIPITFKSTSRFAGDIAHLTLAMANDITSRLPPLLASSLQSLALYHLPKHFTWRDFISDSPQHITFANLQELRVQFRSENVSKYLGKYVDSEDKIVEIIANDSKHRLLHFPKLEVLELWNIPYNDSAFYNVFERSPLKLFRIRGSFKSVKLINIGLLLNVSRLDIEIYSFSEARHNELPSFTERLFSSPLNVNTSAIYIGKRNGAISVPDNIRWAKLKQLILGTDVTLSSIMNFVTKCPELYRIISCIIINDFEDIEAAIKMVLKQGSSHAGVPNCKLSFMHISNPASGELKVDMNPLFYLILVVRTLKYLCIPTCFSVDVSDFIAYHSFTFPHLSKITIISRG
ncbi:hypothetical protein GGI12_002682 [Dipsacomyces acuminosporus]|nr:hypothetical protein GGI12_002682 [Dipsacomyces acuminosporus]